MTSPDIPVSSNIIFAFKRFSRIAGIAVACIGILVLLGWILDVPLLKSILPIWVTMKVNTAIGFLLAGLSLWFFHLQQQAPRLRLAGWLFAGVVALLGAVTLSQYFTGVDLGIDQLFFKESISAIETSHPGRMAPMTAFNFLMIGFAFLGLYRGKTVQGADACAGIALVISLAACLGYLYDVKHLYGISVYTTMALHTAVTLSLLCFGVFCARPEEGFIALAASDSAGGVMLRHLVPLMAGTLIVIGWLRLLGQRMGLFTMEFGVSLLVLSSILALTVFMWRNARLLLHLDSERRDAQVNLRYASEMLEESSRQRMMELARTSEGFESIVETAQDAVIAADQKGSIVFWNQKAQALFGYSKEAIYGLPLTTIIPQRFQPAHEAGIKRFISTGEAHVIGKTVELAGLRKDGREFPIELSLSQWKIKEAQFFTAIIRDTTQRKKDEADIQALKQQVKVLAEQLASKAGSA